MLTFRKYLIPFLMALVVILSPKSPGVHPRYFLFFFLFGIVFWQRERLRQTIESLSRPKTQMGRFFLIVLVWALLTETLLTRAAVGKKPLIAYFLSLGFVLPYFYFWYKWIFSKKGLSCQQVFYLSGFSAGLLQTFLTPKIVSPFFNYRPFLALLVALFNFTTMMAVFGTVTTLPYLLVFKQPLKANNLDRQALLTALGATLIGSLALILVLTILKLLIA